MVCFREEHGAFENQIFPGNSLRTSAPKPRPTFLGARRGNHLQLDREGKVLLGGMDRTAPSGKSPTFLINCLNNFGINYSEATLLES